MTTGGTSYIAAVLVVVWMGVMAWQDVRTGQISNWLTVTPLLGSALWWLARGEWRVAALLLAMLAAGEIQSRLRRPAAWSIGVVIPLAGIWAASTTADIVFILIGWTCVWAAWTLHLIGGADAKAVMALLAFFPNPLLAGLLVAAQLLWSIFHLVRRYGGRSPGVALNGIFSRPTQDDLVAQGVPLMPAYAAAVMVFMFLSAG